MQNTMFSLHMVETERLRLRPVVLEDTDLLHQMWIDPGVRRYLWDDVVIDRETAAHVVEATVEDWRERGYGLWVAEHNGEAIGFVGFRSSEDDARPELLFGFLPAYWGRGIASEAARATLELIFATHEEIWGATDPPNTASVRVMERIGMTFERRGTLNGLDTLFFAMKRPR